MSRRAKISRIEEVIASKLKDRQERRKRLAKALPIHAQRHATAVAAIVLAGKPKIEEPLNRAWARTLRHYEIALDPQTVSKEVRAAQMLFPIIVGKQTASVRFAKIFSTAPPWLLQFTRTVLDAWILRFRLPAMKPSPNWGSAGIADGEHWPALPKGVQSAGESIPLGDARHLMIAMLCVGPPLDHIPDNFDFFGSMDSPEHEGGTIADDMSFALSLDEKPEWSAYERRRMRKILRRLSLDDWSDHA